ncbi:hypothetical protein [Streptomyces sporangiiformans]|uniref:DUF4333 domain-containing protein n=1 Tax=Streptomyces sporangiiformans TaxID=2315329 RepID=A0A505DC40_9ACTN|nr:hypothetical protein [Streptomyces sporangiiformans]TPQ16846.1 hypothetical protein FGD71_040330 [Streptomyces sporangiiformans]
MLRKTLVMTGAGVAAVAAGLGALTYAMSGTESTTGLDHPVLDATVDGHEALSGRIVASRTQSKYHPLPWIGSEVSKVSCPDLKAVAGTKVTCTGEDDGGKSVSIPVAVVKASDSAVTWKFER